MGFFDFIGNIGKTVSNVLASPITKTVLSFIPGAPAIAGIAEKAAGFVAKLAPTKPPATASAPALAQAAVAAPNVPSQVVGQTASGQSVVVPAPQPTPADRIAYSASTATTQLSTGETIKIADALADRYPGAWNGATQERKINAVLSVATKSK